MTALSTVAWALVSLSRGTPAFDVAPTPTVMTILAPAGNAFDGRNARTVSFSPHRKVPVSFVPFAVADQAAIVDLRSIGWVKRTESRASRATRSNRCAGGTG